MKISQREARRLQKRVAALEYTLNKQRQSYASDWGADWVHLESLTLSDASFAKVNTARRLSHAVIVLPQGNSSINLYASRLPYPTE